MHPDLDSIGRKRRKPRPPKPKPPKVKKVRRSRAKKVKPPKVKVPRKRRSDAGIPHGPRPRVYAQRSDAGAKRLGLPRGRERRPWGDTPAFRRWRLAYPEAYAEHVAEAVERSRLVREAREKACFLADNEDLQ